jgi:hypothetical protein
MSTKGFFVSLAMAALVTPVFAAEKQVATSPAEIKALGHLAWVTRANDPRPAPPSCCNKKDGRITTQTAVSPSELKAIGYLAWAARANDPVPAPECVKRMPTQKAAYKSPSEIKAFGHLAMRTLAAPAVPASKTAGCCVAARCPMRSAS